MVRLLAAARGRGETADAPERAQAAEEVRRTQFERLAQEHAAALYGTALRMTRSPDDAQDLVQDCLVQAYTAFDSFRMGTNFRAWALRILTNRYITAYRRRRRIRIFSWGDTKEGEGDPGEWDDMVEDGGQDPAAQLLNQTLDAEWENALAALSDPVRLTVLLVDVEQLSYDEAAAALGVPVGTVRSRLNRGRELLRARLAQFVRQRRLSQKA